MFSVDNIHVFLQDQKLITANSYINGDYVATSVNRRNRNLQITTLSEGNYLIKQVNDKNSENAKTLATEILFYNYLEDSCPRLRKYYPLVIYSDINNVMLILEFYTNAIQLWKYYKNRTIENMPLGTISEVGTLLSQIHAIFSDQQVFNDPKLSFLQKDLPFAFGINKPEPKLLSYIRPGGIKYIQNIQSNEDIMSIWNSISKMWEMNSIIHGDIKLDNFLVIENPDNNNTDSQTVKIIDWEMVQFGDYAWDIAGVFQDFIFWWAISMPNEDRAEEMVKNAAFPIHKLQPGILRFWESYNNNLIVTEHQREKLLLKVVHFAGLRVLQTAYEISSKFDEIPPIAEVLLGIGKSILRKPEEAASHLFGIHNKINQYE